MPFIQNLINESAFHDELFSLQFERIKICRFLGNVNYVKVYNHYDKNKMELYHQISHIFQGNRNILFSFYSTKEDFLGKCLIK